MVPPLIVPLFVKVCPVANDRLFDRLNPLAVHALPSGNDRADPLPKTRPEEVHADESGKLTVQVDGHVKGLESCVPTIPVGGIDICVRVPRRSVTQIFVPSNSTPPLTGTGIRGLAGRTNKGPRTVGLPTPDGLDGEGTSPANAEQTENRKTKKA